MFPRPLLSIIKKHAKLLVILLLTQVSPLFGQDQGNLLRPLIFLRGAQLPKRPEF